MTAPEMTLAGFASATFGGIVSGVTYDAPFMRGLGIAVGLEVAGYAEDILISIFGDKPVPQP